MEKTTNSVLYYRLPTLLFYFRVLPYLSMFFYSLSFMQQTELASNDATMTISTVNTTSDNKHFLHFN